MITAHLGPHQVIVMDKWTAFAAEHAVRDYTTITLKDEDFKPYIPAGQSVSYHRFPLPSGNWGEDASFNFTIKSRQPSGYDGVIIVPHRAFPDEAITDLGKITSKVSMDSAIWEVASIDPNENTIFLKRFSSQNESGRSVYDSSGKLIGFASGRTPDSSKTIVSVPARLFARNEPEVVQKTETSNNQSTEYDRGFEAGKEAGLKAAVEKFKTFLGL